MGVSSNNVALLKLIYAMKELDVEISMPLPLGGFVILSPVFSFLIQNICCGYSKEPSPLAWFFEHPKHMLKLMDKP